MQNVFLVSILMVFLRACLTCEKFSSDHIQQTCPYTNEQLMILIDSLPTYDDNDPCLSVEKCARNWMYRANDALGKVSERASVLQYQYETNKTLDNYKLTIEFLPVLNRLKNILFFTGKQFFKNSDNWPYDLQRMLFLTRKVDISEPDLIEIVNKMSEIYANCKVVKDNRTYHLEPHLTNIMTYSRNYSKLLWAWESWFNNVGFKIKDLFKKSVDLENEYASKYGYKDLSESWIADFEVDEFEKVYDQLYNEIKPIYQQLHAYVRRKLRIFYGSDKIKSKFIPAHLLGNMWSKVWTNIYDIVVPFKSVRLFNITANMQASNYSAFKMFKDAEKFYTSIGLYPMTDTFWKYSMFVKPSDGREVDCHGSAIDFSNSYDYRIKMCAHITDSDFYKIHHEMGRVEYFMSYSEQPAIFRNGANSGFHEAIGDAIVLSVNNPTHLKKIGFLTHFTPNHEIELNFLMKMALQKLALLPFTYLVDKWRWNVFRGEITPENYNEKWWEMVKTFQGIEPPMPRNESYFDAGALYQIATYKPYSRYYIAEFLQFQFYKSLCRLAGHLGQLYLCDFYNSRKAGWKLKEMLALGASKHWSHTLKGLTGSDKINSSAILEYFKPLMQWLVTENSKFLFCDLQ